jgi:hypothetical protein
MMGFHLDINENIPGIGADVDESFLKECESWTI